MKCFSGGRLGRLALGFRSSLGESAAPRRRVVAIAFP